jgi:hypothetical protein
MIDAVLGAMIMVLASTSLVLALEASDGAFRSSSRFLLTPAEGRIVDGAKWSKYKNDLVLDLERYEGK